MARRRPSLEAQLLELPSFYAAAAAAPPTQQSPKQRLTATFARFRRPSHHARAYSTTEIPPVDMPSPRANDSKRFSLPGVMTKRKARSSMDEEVARTPHWDTSPLVTTLAYLTGLEPRSPVAGALPSLLDTRRCSLYAQNRHHLSPCNAKRALIGERHRSTNSHRRRPLVSHIDALAPACLQSVRIRGRSR